MSAAGDLRRGHLVALRDALAALLSTFQETKEGLEVSDEWASTQRLFLRWANLRRASTEVEADELLIEEECQRMYATLQSVTNRSLEGLRDELDSLRVVRSKLRAATERRSGATARAVDLHG